MQNLFSKYKITKGLRMYPTDDGNNKKYGKDPKFFVSSNTSISEGAYTLVGKWYSYALLNMYGETVKSVFCEDSHKVGITIDSPEIKYITVCGYLKDIDTMMCLDKGSDELPDNPGYIENTTDNSINMNGTTGVVTTIVNTVVSSYIANDFVYDEADNSYKVSSFTPPCDKYEDLFDTFLLYTNNIDHIKKDSKLNLFGKYFKIQHVNGQDMKNDLEAVPNVLNFFVNKDDMTARMMYSFNMTTQTGLGLEDIWMDVEEGEDE